MMFYAEMPVDVVNIWLAVKENYPKEQHECF